MRACRGVAWRSGKGGGGHAASLSKERGNSGLRIAAIRPPTVRTVDGADVRAGHFRGSPHVQSASIAHAEHFRCGTAHLGRWPRCSALHGLVGTEKLGKLYEYMVEVMTVESPTFRVWQAKELVSPETLVGKELALSIEYEGKGTFSPGLPGGIGSANVGAGTREITGLITEVRCTGADDRPRVLPLIVRPWLWIATLNRENRIFQEPECRRDHRIDPEGKALSVPLRPAPRRPGF